jgi:hypothetical protein
MGLTPRFFRGTVTAAGFLFDEHLLGAGEARRRALALWRRESRVRRTPHGLTLSLPAPRRIAVDGAPGMPLVSNGGALVGFEATATEIRALGAASGSIIVLRAGRVEVLPDGDEIAPEDWIELGPVTVVATSALSAPRPLTLEAPASRSLQEVLGPAIPPPAEERQAFMREAWGGSARLTGLLPSALSFLDWLRSLARWGRRSAGGAAGRSGRAGAAAGESSGLGARLGELWSQIQRWIGLQRLLGRRHGQYLASVMDMLTRGDVHEGLRHAIPLQAVKDALTRTRGGTMPWRVPSARAQLAISPVRVPARSSLVLGDSLFAQLRQLYRQTFERLDAQGRLEEAAFVLAELLQADEEAVAYLERNGELRRAAELAESRNCAPGLIVRAWFLAGDRDRAVSIARERGAFRDAVARLGSRHSEEARQLRALWADSLAASGSYADAVGLVHGIEEMRSLVLRWIELGLASDEAQAPRLLAFQAALVPECWPETQAVAESWLSSEDERAAARRRALAEAVSSVPLLPGARRLARLCARRILTHGGADVPAVSQPAMEALLKAGDAEALAADLPRTGRKGRTRWVDGGDSLATTIEPRGLVSVRDAIVLSSGRLLVAEGDAGVVLLGRGGALLHRFDCPADSLVISDGNDRAIALAARGESTQLSQLDLPTRRHRSWGLVSIKGWARTYDGGIWFAYDGWRLMGLDAMAQLPRCFWSVKIDEESIIEITRTERELLVLTGGWGMESWRYEFPGPVLRERKPIKLGLKEDPPGAATTPFLTFGAWCAPGGATYLAAGNVGAHELVLVAVGASRMETRLPLEMGCEQVTGTAAVMSDLFALSLGLGPDAEVLLFDRVLAVRARFRFPRSKPPNLRFCGPNLVMATEQGRFTIFDTDRGALRNIAVPGS